MEMTKFLIAVENQSDHLPEFGFVGIMLGNAVGFIRFDFGSRIVGKNFRRQNLVSFLAVVDSYFVNVHAIQTRLDDRHINVENRRALNLHAVGVVVVAGILHCVNKLQILRRTRRAAQESN